MQTISAPEFTQKIGEFIRQRREDAGLTQLDLVQGLALRQGRQYNKSMVGHWERGRAVPPIDDPQFVHALAEILGVSEAEILEAAGFNPELFTDPPEEMPDWLVKMYTEATPKQRTMIQRVFKSLLTDDEESEQG